MMQVAPLPSSCGLVWPVHGARAASDLHARSDRDIDMGAWVGLYYVLGRRSGPDTMRWDARYPSAAGGWDSAQRVGAMFHAHRDGGVVEGPGDEAGNRHVVVIRRPST
jgi:hypothetical protein